MAEGAEIEAKFWKALKASPYLMLALDALRDGQAQPMTAFFEAQHDPIWFFTSTDHALFEAVKNHRDHPATASFASKGHDVFAALHGKLEIDNSEAMIDRYWNAEVAAWYDGGRRDPKLALLRFDADNARIWASASSFTAPIRRLFGSKPQESGRVTEILL